MNNKTLISYSMILSLLINILFFVFKQGVFDITFFETVSEIFILSIFCILPLFLIVTIFIIVLIKLCKNQYSFFIEYFIIVIMLFILIIQYLLPTARLIIK